MMDTSEVAPPNISISQAEVTAFKNLLNGEVQRYRALVDLSNLTGNDHHSPEPATAAPLVERLKDYPNKSVNLTNLVTYPPKLEPIPVKPLFFDAAWNYIEYPGRQVQEINEKVQERPQPAAEVTDAPAQQKKKGWFF
jgi:signal recognition particle subunit SRP68